MRSNLFWLGIAFAVVFAWFFTRGVAELFLPMAAICISIVAFGTQIWGWFEAALRRLFAYDKQTAVREAVASSEPGTRTGTGTNEPADEPAEEADELHALAATMQRYSDDDLFAVLAILRKADGSFRYSANQLAEFRGGTRAKALTMVRETRATAPAMFRNIRNGDVEYQIGGAK